MATNNTNVIDRRWVMLEEGYPHTVFLTKDEADDMVKRYESKFPEFEYSLFYDEYYEFTEIIEEN